MNKQIAFFLLCPIPEEQKPLQAYLTLKENSFLGWATFSNKKYNQRILSVGAFFFLLSFASRIPVFEVRTDLVECLLFSFQSIFGFLALSFFRWQQVEKKFLEETLPYEEGSWYASQIWKKPVRIQQTDKVIWQQKILPILQRILRSLYTAGLAIVGCFFFLQFQ